MTRPPTVTQKEWEAALERLRVKEKELTRAHDALAAERRRLPWVRIEKDYVFQGPDGKARLVDLFGGRRQLLLYHFMFGPNQTAGCDGCSMFVDQVGHLAHLHARDTSFVLVSRASIAVLEAYRKRMGWHIVALVMLAWVAVPVLGWMMARFAYALVRNAESVSRLAGGLRRIELIDPTPLGPFSRASVGRSSSS